MRITEVRISEIHTRNICSVEECAELKIFFCMRQISIGRRNRRLDVNRQSPLLGRLTGMTVICFNSDNGIKHQLAIDLRSRCDQRID